MIYDYLQEADILYGYFLVCKKILSTSGRFLVTLNNDFVFPDSEPPVIL